MGIYTAGPVSLLDETAPRWAPPCRQRRKRGLLRSGPTGWVLATPLITVSGSSSGGGRTFRAFAGKGGGWTGYNATPQTGILLADYRKRFLGVGWSRFMETSVRRRWTASAQVELQGRNDPVGRHPLEQPSNRRFLFPGTSDTGKTSRHSRCTILPMTFIYRWRRWRPGHSSLISINSSMARSRLGSRVPDRHCGSDVGHLWIIQGNIGEEARLPPATQSAMPGTTVDNQCAAHVRRPSAVPYHHSER